MGLLDRFFKKPAPEPPKVNDQDAIIATLRKQKNELIDASLNIKAQAPGRIVADIGIEVQKIMGHVTADVRDIKFASNLARYQLPRLIELLRTYISLQDVITMEAAGERDRAEKVFAQMLEAVRTTEDLCRRNEFESLELESRTLDAVLGIQQQLSQRK